MPSWATRRPARTTTGPVEDMRHLAGSRSWCAEPSRAYGPAKTCSLPSASVRSGGTGPDRCPAGCTPRQVVTSGGDDDLPDHPHAVVEHADVGEGACLVEGHAEVRSGTGRGQDARAQLAAGEVAGRAHRDGCGRLRTEGHGVRD